MKKFTLLIMAPLLLSACTQTPFGGVYKAPDVETYNEQGESEIRSATTSFDSGIIKAFPDIPIPSTHRINLEKSVIFTSPSQTIGKVTLDGAGDADSLFRFFESNMQNNGWSMVNAFQSSTSSMYFAKPGRFVAVIIEALSTGGSRVYINVGPE